MSAEIVKKRGRPKKAIVEETKIILTPDPIAAKPKRTRITKKTTKIVGKSAPQPLEVPVGSQDVAGSNKVAKVSKRAATAVAEQDAAKVIEFPDSFAALPISEGTTLKGVKPPAEEVVSLKQDAAGSESESPVGIATVEPDGRETVTELKEPANKGDLASERTLIAIATQLATSDVPDHANDHPSPSESHVAKPDVANSTSTKRIEQELTESHGTLAKQKESTTNISSSTASSRQTLSGLPLSFPSAAPEPLNGTILWSSLMPTSTSPPTPTSTPQLPPNRAPKSIPPFPAGLPRPPPPPPAPKPTELPYNVLKKNPEFKALSRKYTSIIIAVPIALVTSYALYERCRLTPLPRLQTEN